MTHNKFGRRYKRHQEKHRDYFEGIARRVVKGKRTTVDLGVVVFDVRLRRRLFWRFLEYIESDGSVSSQRVFSEFKGESLIRMIVGELIHRAAETSGATIPAASEGS